MSENTIEITSENFEEIIGGEKPVLVDFWAEWCGPCRAVAPTLDEFASENKETLSVGKVDVDSQSELAAKYGIRSIPTFVFFKDGEIVNKKVGSVSKSELEELVGQE